ncbi:MAG: hypothetical protein ABI321_02480 [Polyangia bacterium]
MSQTTTWMVFAVMVAGGVAYSLWRIAAQKQGASESIEAYLTRLYGQDFLVRPGESLTRVSVCADYSGERLPVRGRMLGPEIVGAAARLGKTVAAAAVGVRLKYRPGQQRLALTSLDRLVLTVERGAPGNFVPEAWGAGTRVLTDEQAFGRKVEGGPPLLQLGVGGSWTFILLVDDERQRGLWVEPAFATMLLERSA